jgi:tripeptide aminopeptidase
MKNALTIGMEFEMLLLAQQKPEFTEKYDGFFHLTAMTGEVEQAAMHYIIRDHDSDKLEEKKSAAHRAADFLNGKYGEGTITLTIRDSYRNMVEQIRPHWHLVDNAFEAMRRTGVEPVAVPIRGGTDGARLSFMGLPCPNLGTGGGNFHGKLEYCCVEEMDLAVDCMKHLVEIYSKLEK